MRQHDRILVVDDDPGMRRAIERILAPTYSVESVAGASEAMDCLERSEFDLALVDVRLKEGDGYTLCHAIRARWPETDVILITGSISEPDEKLFRSLEEGAFYFLFKPFDRRVLRALVERCLRLQQEKETKDRYAEALAGDLEKARQEMGDVLFVVANLARTLDVDPEDALRATNAKFTRRFHYIEAKLAERGKTPDQSDLAEMDALWDEVRKAEKRVG